MSKVKRAFVAFVAVMALPLLVAQVNTFQKIRFGGGTSGKLAEVDSSGRLLVVSNGTASAIADTGAPTFPRFRIAGGTSGNLAEVDSAGRLLVYGGGASTLTYERINTPNAADTNYVSSTLYTLPANTLGTNGDRLEVEFPVSFDGTAATKTYTCNIGHTAYDATSGFTGGINMLSSATTSTSVTIVGRGVVTRISGTQSSVYAFNGISSGSWQTTAWTTSTAVDWSASQPVRCIGKSSVGTGGIITIQEMRLTLVPR